METDILIKLSSVGDIQELDVVQRSYFLMS